MKQEYLPPIPRGVVLFTADADPVVRHWRKHYARLVATAQKGAPTALAVTMRWSRAEVAFAVKQGIDPVPGRPPH